MASPVTASAASAAPPPLQQALARALEKLKSRPHDGHLLDEAAVLLYQAGQLDAAAQTAAAAADARPGDALIHDHLGLILLAAGRAPEAVQAARRAAALAPRDGAIALNLGNALLAATETAAAITALERAASLLPREPLVRFNLGNALARAGRRPEAIDSLRRAVSLAPQLEPARRNLALLLREDGRSTEATAVLRSLVNSSDPAVLHLLGTLFLDTGDPASALGPLQRAAGLRFDDPNLHLDLARCLLRLGRPEEAATASTVSVRLAPQNPVAWNIRGLCQREPAEAEACHRRALELRPGFPDAAVNLARQLVAAGRAAEALPLLESTLALSPEEAELHYTHAVVLRELDRTSAAREANLRALECRPDHANARWNLSLCNLRLGRFTEGWPGYEGRWINEAKEPRRHTHLPEWPLDCPAEGHLLVWGEQGIGDEVLFTACLAAIRPRVRQLTLACAPRLVPLFQRSFPDLAVVAQPASAADAAPPFAADWQIPLGSLPARVWTSAGPPHAGAPWLRADPQQVAELRARYASGRKPLVGLSWKTTNAHTGAARNIPAQLWAPALAGLDARFLSLQYGDCTGDLAVATAAGLDLFADPAINPLADLDGFAAQVSAVDVVISIDNSTAHFAGALGRPTWVLLPTPCDWRWGLDVSESPWYASAHLLRRRPQEEWGPALTRTVAEVATFLATPPP